MQGNTEAELYTTREQPNIDASKHVTLAKCNVLILCKRAARRNVKLKARQEQDEPRPRQNS